MSYTVEGTSSGVLTYPGAPGGISSTQAGAITTSGTNRLVVIAVFTGRSQANGAGQTTSIQTTAINATGLTFTRQFSKQYNYIPSGGDAGFPNACMSLDVFTAPAAAAQTAKAWTTTMGGDGVINNQMAFVFSIAGLPDINNASAMVTKEASNFTGAAAGPLVPGVVTGAEALIAGFFSCRNPGYTYQAESGYTILAQNSASGNATTNCKFMSEYFDEPSGISKTIGDHTGTTDMWYGAIMAFGLSVTPPISERCFGRVIS